MAPKIHARMLSIGSDLTPQLADAIKTVGPVSLRRASRDPVDQTLCRMVAGQQLSTLAARTIWSRVTDFVGTRPFIETIREATETELRQCGLSRAKITAMKAIAAASDAGELGRKHLKSLPHPDRVHHLTRIKGVGPWTANMMGIFYFADPDIWPNGDLTVRKTLQSLLADTLTTHEASDRFIPHRTYLALTMWQYADLASR